MKACRPQLTDSEIGEVHELLSQMTGRRLAEKGRGAFVGRHEILGAVMEEMHELEHAVHIGSNREALAELLDIAVAAIIGVASIKSGKTDW